MEAGKFLSAFWYPLMHWGVGLEIFTRIPEVRGFVYGMYPQEQPVPHWGSANYMLPWIEEGVRPQGTHAQRAGRADFLEVLLEAETKDDVALLFGSAFCKDQRDELHDHWRGAPYMLLSEVQQALYQAGAPRFHHATRSLLPVSHLNSESAPPTNVREVAHMAAVDAVLSVSCWRIAKVVPRDSPVELKVIEEET